MRAGGDINRTAAVVPCCQTLGPPNEAKSILGHLDKNTFEEVYFDVNESLRTIKIIKPSLMSTVISGYKKAIKS